MTRLVAFLLIAMLGWLTAPAQSRAQPSEKMQTRVENAIAFLTQMGGPEDLRTAANLRKLLDDGKILVGNIDNAEDKSSLAWTEYGVIYLNPDNIGTPRPYNEIDLSPIPLNLNEWASAFALAQTLVHEYQHVDQGQKFINYSKGRTNRIILGNPDYSELEGWREGFSAGTRWLKELEERLERLGPTPKAVFAGRLSFVASELRGSINDFMVTGYLGRRGDFSELKWRKPDGSIFRTPEEAEQYLEEYEARLRKIEADARAALAAKPPASKPAPAPAPTDPALDQAALEKAPWGCCEWDNHPNLIHLGPRTCAAEKEPVCKTRPNAKWNQAFQCTNTSQGRCVPPPP